MYYYLGNFKICTYIRYTYEPKQMSHLVVTTNSIQKGQSNIEKKAHPF